LRRKSSSFFISPKCRKKESGCVYTNRKDEQLGWIVESKGKKANFSALMIAPEVLQEKSVVFE
jgi:hypothetical protein